MDENDPIRPTCRGRFYDLEALDGPAPDTGKWAETRPQMNTFVMM